MKKLLFHPWGANPPQGSPLLQVLGKLLALMVIDATAIWFLITLGGDEVWLLFAFVLVITLGVNIVFLKPSLYPIRWLSPGLVLMILMVLFPLMFTVYTAFTNYSDGHLLTKIQAAKLLEKQQYLPQGAEKFKWAAFRSPDGLYALWLTSAAGKTYLVKPGEPQQDTANLTGLGAVDSDGIPSSINEYQRIQRKETIRIIADLGKLTFGLPPNEYKVRSMDVAAQFQQKYSYDPARDAILDNSTETTYQAINGFFQAEDGTVLQPGYQFTVGAANFKRLVESPALTGPLVTVFIWTLLFAALSVLTTFGLGLFLGVLFDDLDLHKKKWLRSILIIPYAIPGFISILIWVGLFNPQMGVVTTTLTRLFGSSPDWFADPTWAKVGILIVNLWLGYPYMMLISSGALQSIPREVLEAATIDGASEWQKFKSITLPLLLLTIGPLLISSFAYNFNNFNVIYLYNAGGPPIPGTTTPAGYTDILISYTYRLAFAGGRGADYGYASAITIIIFVLVAFITIMNYRFTNIWEEVSENV